MKLKNLTIAAAQSWDSFDGYRGEATFESPTGTITHRNDI